MGRRRKKKPKQHQSLTRSHSSLLPGFDEVNDFILAQIEKEKTVEKFTDGLVCERCGMVYEINNHNKAGMYCNQFFRENGKYEACNGQIFLEKNVIKLPDVVKTGKKYDYNSGTGWNGVEYTTGWESHKHSADVVVFEHEGKQLFAGNGHSIDEKSGKWGLIIDLAGVIQVPKPSAFIREDMPSRFKALKDHLDKDETLPSEILRLYWNDMGTPPAGIDFWSHMWMLLPEKTAICCVGGHGRTGTAIASLMIAAGVDYYTALEDVRVKHCNKAVESLSQEQYLHAIYVEYLQRALASAKAAHNLADVKDIVEDIEYAMAHKPTYLPIKKDEVKNQSVIPFKEKEKSDGTSTEDIKADAEMLDQRTKIVGDKIFVEECVNIACTDGNCADPDHMGWVPWDYSTLEAW